jgi:hypothetical protein
LMHVNQCAVRERTLPGPAPARLAGFSRTRAAHTTGAPSLRASRQCGRALRCGVRAGRESGSSREQDLRGRHPIVRSDATVPPQEVFGDPLLVIPNLRDDSCLLHCRVDRGPLLRSEGVTLLFASRYFLQDTLTIRQAAAIAGQLIP